NGQGGAGTSGNRPWGESRPGEMESVTNRSDQDIERQRVMQQLEQLVYHTESSSSVESDNGEQQPNQTAKSSDSSDVNATTHQTSEYSELSDAQRPTTPIRGIFTTRALLLAFQRQAEASIDALTDACISLFGAHKDNKAKIKILSDHLKQTNMAPRHYYMPGGQDSSSSDSDEPTPATKQNKPKKKKHNCSSSTDNDTTDDKSDTSESESEEEETPDALAAGNEQLNANQQPDALAAAGEQPDTPASANEQPNTSQSSAEMAPAHEHQGTIQ